MTFRIRIALRLALAAAVGVTALARAAHGEEPPPAAAAPALTPPKLTKFVPAQAPESAGTPPRTEPVDVDVEITIDATGTVTEGACRRPLARRSRRSRPPPSRR